MADDETPFALAIWAFQNAEFEFTSDLEELGFKKGTHYGRIGWDDYDNSVEFYGVSNDLRLTAERQKVVFDAGFSKAFVNHKDGWETHYTWEHANFALVRGWRRYIEHDKEPGPSGVIGFRCMKISYWPESWGKELERDLKAGKIEIVPDPLEPPLDTQEPSAHQ